MCKACMGGIFDAAITVSGEFPPKWEGKTLDPRDFRHIVTRDYLAKYDLKCRELRILVVQRMYCRHITSPGSLAECNNFLGRQKLELASVQCSTCSAHTCMRCKEAYPRADLVDPATGSYHRCDTSADASLFKQNFKGQRQGKDYQYCPNGQCRAMISLWDGCNHMTCPECKIGFCYVCGAVADEDSGHWVSGCPRWGQPGTGHHDNDDSSAASDGSDGEDDDDFFQSQLHALHEQGMHPGQQPSNNTHGDPHFGW